MIGKKGCSSGILIPEDGSQVNTLPFRCVSFSDHVREVSGSDDVAARLAAVVIAGLLIVSLCGWRLQANAPQTYTAQLEAATVERPAPDFEALDAQNQMFRLQRYLGRHRVLVVFYDADLTVADDPAIASIRRAFPDLRARDIQVVGVSTALPQQNRAHFAAGEEFPFPLVTDLDLSIHQRWGRFDEPAGKPLPGVFLIDRKGSVPCFGFNPRPVSDLETLLTELTAS